MNATESHHKPEIVPARSSWLVWIIPLIALFIGAYLITKEFSNRGPVITITFQEGSGLEADKTKLISKGVVVGVVESIQLSENLKNVVVKARLQKSMGSLAKTETRMWIVRPVFDASGFHGMDTIMNGPYIEVEPGQGKSQRIFEGLNQRPRNSQESHAYILHTDRRITAQPGVPVIFRGIEVGNVDTVQLSEDSTEVLVGITIEEPYFRLIRKGTKFWDSGGVDMKVNLMGARIKTGSLESILTGAVEFATPPSAASTPVAHSGSHFRLHQKVDEKWLEWEASIELPLDPIQTDNRTLEETLSSNASLLESDS